MSNMWRVVDWVATMGLQQYNRTGHVARCVCTDGKCAHTKCTHQTTKYKLDPVWHMAAGLRAIMTRQRVANIEARAIMICVRMIMIVNNNIIN